MPYFCILKKNRRIKIRKTVTKADRIFKILQNHFTKLYLQFLSHILPLVCNRNKEFQSETPKIHTLYNKMFTLFKTITSFYLEDDYVERTDLELLAYCNSMRNEENTRCWVHSRSIDLGPVITEELVYLLAKLPANDIEEFRMSCRLFYKFS